MEEGDGDVVGQDSGLLEKQPWALPIKTLEKHHLVSMGGIQSVAAWLGTVPYSQPCGTAGLSWGGGSGICSISGEAPAALSRGGAQTTPGFLLSRDILGTQGGAATLCPNAWAVLGLSEAVALGAALCFSAPWGAAPLCGGLCFILRLSLLSAQRESLCSYGDRGIWGTLQHNPHMSPAAHAALRHSAPICLVWGSLSPWAGLQLDVLHAGGVKATAAGTALLSSLGPSFPRSS